MAFSAEQICCHFQLWLNALLRVLQQGRQPSYHSPNRKRLEPISRPVAFHSHLTMNAENPIDLGRQDIYGNILAFSGALAARTILS